MFARRNLLSAAIAVALTLSCSTEATRIVRRDVAPITLPVVKRVNMTGTAKLLQNDQARARALRARAEGKTHSDLSVSVPVTNAVVTYIATVGVGNPPQQFDLLVDTGSSNTWVGAQAPKQFDPDASSTARDTDDLVSVTYGSGFFIGEEFLDTITLAPGLVINNQSFGDSLLAEGFNDDIDGIFGIGPTVLTCGTLFSNANACIPTVTDNAFNQGVIDSKEVGMSYAPTTSVSDSNGELTFGGINPAKFTGPLQFVPITSTFPSNEFVGIDQAITYGKDAASTPILNSTAGIVDSGTTLILIATDALNIYQATTNATLDPNTGLLQISPDQYANLQSLFFHIGDTTYELVPNAQIWPRALNTVIGGQPDAIYLIVGDIGTLGGSGLDFINGMVFLERFYHVYDSGTNRAGFATTSHTNDETN